MSIYVRQMMVVQREVVDNPVVYLGEHHLENPEHKIRSYNQPYYVDNSKKNNIK
jgi:hypothetical protein